MKTVLLAVCGLAPQVITETLYALYQQGRLPDIVRVITTREGKEACHAQLFGDGSGQYYRFLHDYNISSELIDFTPQAIIPVLDDQNIEIADIVDEKDNRSLLWSCMRLAFKYSSDETIRIYYSIAGGRKTMSSCLVLAAQLYGRPQDRIFHVLVSPEFENCREFYYPPSPSRQIILFDNKQQPYQKDTSYADIQLVPMPFIPLREKLSGSLLQQAEMPSTLMMSLVEEEKFSLVVDLKKRKIIWKNREADLPPVLLALYAFFAEQKKRASCFRLDCDGCQQCSLELSQILDTTNLTKIAGLYQQIRPDYDPHSMSSTGINSLSAENFNSIRSKLNKKLEDVFGAYEKNTIQLAHFGSKPGVRYGLKLEGSRITLSW